MESSIIINIEEKVFKNNMKNTSLMPKLCTYPVNHIIIENFFTEEFNLILIKEAEKLNKISDVGTVGNDHNIKISIKNNKNLWLFKHYEEHPDEYNLAKVFEEKMWNSGIKEVLRNTNDIACMSELTTTAGSLLLSAYHNDNYYDIHRDKNRGLTFNYLFSREPLSFSGGSFIICDYFDKDSMSSIPFKNNSLIIFPSRTLHGVESVVSNNEDSTRFSLQYWGLN